MRFSPVSGTISATVASATRPRERISHALNRSLTRPPSPSRNAISQASLNATPAPHRSPNGYADAASGRRGCTTTAAGGRRSPGVWWSVTINSSPSSLARSASATEVIAAVHGDDQAVRLLGVEPFDRGHVQPVAVAAVGDDVVRVRPGQPQTVDQQCGRGDAVHIVVAEDRDPPIRPHRGDDAVRGLRHAGQSVRLVQIVRRGGEKRLGGGRFVQAAGDQHLGGQRSDRQRLRQPPHAGRVQRGEPPRERHRRGPARGWGDRWSG